MRAWTCRYSHAWIHHTNRRVSELSPLVIWQVTDIRPVIRIILHEDCTIVVQVVNIIIVIITKVNFIIIFLLLLFLLILLLLLLDLLV